MNNESVFETIKGDQRFSILAGILEETGIGNSLDSERNAFTFFAPTDNAMSELPENAIRTMSSPDGADLAAIILQRHIVPGQYLYADELRSQKQVTTLNGNSVKLGADKNVLTIGRAHILTPGIAAKNGIVFAIDKLLRPRKLSVPDA